MTDPDAPRDEPLPPLGQAPDDPEPEGDPDFAPEHMDTAVSKEIITGDERNREPESPRGWSGMQR